MSGLAPFKPTKDKNTNPYQRGKGDIYDLNMRGQIDFSVFKYKYISREALDLMRKMLSKDPKDRPSAM